jgi:glycosyltransferase involved in cell wall biosynthesis
MGFGRIRKKAAWHLYQKRRLEKNFVLQATSQQEYVHLRELGLRVPISVIPNGTVIPELSYGKDPDPERKKTLLFLSRIHPKKGLLTLIKAISIIKPASWEIIIAGYDEGGHQKSIEDAAERLGVREWFKFIGPVADDRKWDLYQAADAFILPSFSENFGLVVAEALACATPVITTTGTPWKDLLDHHCGWWVDPTVEDLVVCLKQVFQLPPQEFIRMGKNGRKLIEQKYSWTAVAKELIEVYSWMLGSREQPPHSIR